MRVCDFINENISTEKNEGKIVLKRVGLTDWYIFVWYHWCENVIGWWMLILPVQSKVLF